MLRCVWRALDVDAAASVELGTARGGCVSLLPYRRLRVMVVHACRLRLLVAVSVDTAGFDARLLARPPSCHAAGSQWTWMLLCRSSAQLQRPAASPHCRTGSVRWSCFCFDFSLSSPPRFMRLGSTLVSLLVRRSVMRIWTWRRLSRATVHLLLLTASPHCPGVGFVRWYCSCLDLPCSTLTQSTRDV